MYVLYETVTYKLILQATFDIKMQLMMEDRSRNVWKLNEV